MKTTTKLREIPVFYACDDRYIPYLSVSLISLARHAQSDAHYTVYVLHDGLKAENVAKILSLGTRKVRICFKNVTPHLRSVAHKLSLRDYYSLSIYFRLFIPKMFPRLEKAVYIDADTVVLSDIADLFDKKLGSRLVAAVPDAVIASDIDFIRYAEDGVGVPYRRYFNSGVLLMNLAQMRAEDLEGQFTALLGKYGFNTVCPDQDYLNVICRGRVLYLGREWNMMTVDRSFKGVPRIVHYNNFLKPWNYSGVPFEEFFWKYVRLSPYAGSIMARKRWFGEADRARDSLGLENLHRSVRLIVDDERNFKRVLAREGAYA